MTRRPVNINIIATELRDLRPGVERSLCFQSGFQFTVQLTIIIKIMIYIKQEVRPGTIRLCI